MPELFFPAVGKEEEGERKRSWKAPLSKKITHFSKTFAKRANRSEELTINQGKGVEIARQKEKKRGRKIAGGARLERKKS